MDCASYIYTLFLSLIGNVFSKFKEVASWKCIGETPLIVHEYAGGNIIIFQPSPCF